MEKLTKKERKALKKAELALKTATEKKNTMFKKIGIWAGAIIITILAVGGLVLLVNTPTEAPKALKALPEITNSDIQVGSPSAKVTLVEYADFQCPACAAYGKLIKQLLSERGDKILYAYRNFPLPQHQNAKVAAYAAYASHLQGKFMDMDSLLYENQKDWTALGDPSNTFKDYAKKIGLDMTQFEKDFNADSTRKFVEDQQNAGYKLGIASTPTFFINGKQIDSPTNYEEFRKLIDDALKQPNKE